MKVIHILEGKANPNTLNGVNKVVHSLAEKQINNGNEVIVCGIANNIIDRHEYSYSLILIKKSIIKFIPPLKLLKFIKSLDRNSTNTVIHLHSAFISWFPLFVIYLRFFGYKFVVTPHGAYTLNNFKNNFLKLLYFYFFESIILFFAKKIHLIGKSEVNKITNPFLSKKYLIIPNGCEIHNALKYVKTNNLIFGFMGRLKIDHKGLDLFLIGFSQYLKQGGKGIFLIVGDGPDQDNLKKLTIVLNITKYVKFLGVKFGEEKDIFLKEISFFVHTSRWEGFPTSCLEAAAFGIPLMISKETNMADSVIAYNAGFVLKQNNSEEIKNALFYLENQFFNNTYNLLKKGVGKMVKNNFNWDKINMKIENNIYKY